MITENINPETLRHAAEILKTIAHPVRLDILQLLTVEKALSVSEIQGLLGCNCEQSMLSHHLIKMKDKGILSSTKEGKFILYELQLREVSKILDCMRNCSI